MGAFLILMSQEGLKVLILKIFLFSKQLPSSNNRFSYDIYHSPGVLGTFTESPLNISLPTPSFK